jgi:hypothetical protein
MQQHRRGAQGGIRGGESTQWGSSPIGRALGSIWPHALAPLAATLMGSRDPCLGEDSTAINLLPIL